MQNNNETKIYTPYIEIPGSREKIIEQMTEYMVRRELHERRQEIENEWQNNKNRLCHLLRYNEIALDEFNAKYQKQKTDYETSKALVERMIGIMKENKESEENKLLC